MASPLVFKAPHCLSCIRRMTTSFGDVFNFPTGQQIRGKKKLASAKISTVKVHLLQNIPGYGRRGAVIPVTAGVMRNIWFPKRMAEYLTAEKLKELGVKKDSVVERDSTFQTRAVRKLEKKQEKQNQEVTEEPIVRMTEEQPSEPIPQFELAMLSPEQATTIIENLLPSSLEFYRTPISLPTPKRVSPSIPTTSAISAAAASAEGNRPAKPEKRGIYGSVSTGDIAANLKAILAEDEEGVRVVLSHENITFVEETDDKDRVKHLGVFDIDIRLDGAPESVRRTIQIHAQD